MFFVINKEKVYAYVVSILTIVTLFFMSQVLNSDLSNVEETSTNVTQNVETQNSLVQNNEQAMENNSNLGINWKYKDIIKIEKNNNFTF